MAVIKSGLAFEDYQDLGVGMAVQARSFARCSVEKDDADVDAAEAFAHQIVRDLVVL
jgi:hypothetical protein